MATLKSIDEVSMNVEISSGCALAYPEPSFKSIASTASLKYLSEVVDAWQTSSSGDAVTLPRYVIIFYYLHFVVYRV